MLAAVAAGGVTSGGATTAAPCGICCDITGAGSAGTHAATAIELDAPDSFERRIKLPGNDRRRLI